jgi:sialic acid synthase SpsE/sugar phosphate isomerase/epimerase
MLKTNIESPKCFIIAEIGINHNGEKSKAIKLIESAKESGADAIKFQYRNLENAYSNLAKEIGDEILSREINKCFLAPKVLIELTQLAKKLNLKVGISFFDEKDILDFGKEIELFDFFKLPSVELTNLSLIDTLIKLDKHLYISLGAHNEEEIDGVLGILPESGWTPMHCVSNYPVHSQNAQLGYIKYLMEKWNCNVGYSSHDEDWEICLLAINMGISVIERHITLDQTGDGLDHSSSSTPSHFKKISKFINYLPKILAGNSPRIPNQGELLNRQNLGRSYFPIKNFKKGHFLKMSDLVYRSPNTGLDKASIKNYLNKPTYYNIKKGEVINSSLFEETMPISDEIIHLSKKIGLSLPVRFHDLKNIERLFPIGAFEFHLSFKEVLSKIDSSHINRTNKYSIHLPDYINPTNLIDPFSANIEHRALSLKIIDRTAEFAKKLQQKTGKNVPVVGSFSTVHNTREDFYIDYFKLLNKYSQQDVSIFLQWLPPIAWYYGGSVKLNVMNHLKDVEYIKKYKLGICLDICHMILGRNFYDFSADQMIDSLSDNIQHIHIADATGIDGEGMAIGTGDPKNMSLIKKSMNYNCMKVVEVWQGHLDNGAGFRKALTKLTKIYEKK